MHALAHFITSYIVINHEVHNITLFSFRVHELAE